LLALYQSPPTTATHCLRRFAYLGGPERILASDLNGVEMTSGPPVFDSSEAARDIGLLNQRLDDFMTRQKDIPWYKNAAILISAAAFIASIATSVISGLSARQQTISAEVNADKVALHALIKQFNDLQVQLSELQYRAIKDSIPTHDPPSALDTAYTNSNTQSFLIAQQAGSNIDELGANASSTDFGEVGYLQAFAGLLASAERSYKQAILLSKTPLEYSGANLGLAAIQYRTGDKDGSAKSMGEAISAFTKFSAEEADRDYVDAATITSYKSWNQFLTKSDCAIKKQNLTKADGLLQEIGSPFAYSAPNDVQIMKSDIANNCTS
jgi:hypothetical protein